MILRITEKDKNVDQNKIIPGFTQENDSLFDDLGMQMRLPKIIMTI